MIRRFLTLTMGKVQSHDSVCGSRTEPCKRIYARFMPEHQCLIGRQTARRQSKQGAPSHENQNPSCRHRWRRRRM